MSAAPTNPNFICPITQELMVDPVIAPDGITYERAAIEEWLSRGNATSPVTRQPLTSQGLVPNFALKSLIEESKGNRSVPLTIPTQIDAPINKSVSPPINIKAQRIADTNQYHVSIFAEDKPDATLPTLFIDVLDISGSMGSSSVDTSRQKTSDAAMFSRADLVRHAVATQIELLRPEDELAIVLFDDSFQVALDPIKMDTIGRQAAKSVLPRIVPTGGTNIWGGLQRALTIAAGVVDKNIVIILQTDGESDPSLNPPRGIVNTYRAWLDSHPTVRATLHTVGYGFGNALDMPLLRSLADAGRGTVNYIPDGSMVGTVFIHLMANSMTCLYRGVQLQVPEFGVQVPLGFLQGGQSRDAIITCDSTPFDLFVKAENSSESFTLQVTAEVETVPAGFESGRQLFIRALTTALESGKAAPLDAAYQKLSVLAAQDARLAPILVDLKHTDEDKGQIGKSFEGDNFVRWGRHYIPGVVSGHKNQWAINFRDQGCTLYGGPTTKTLINRGDEIFNSLPPPKASCKSYGSHSAAPVSMASINNAHGGCFLGDGLVLMQDGSSKRVDEIQAGDCVHGSAIVKCVVVTRVNEAQIVRLGSGNGCGLTLWHPVLVDGQWQFPALIGTIQTVVTDAVYNFVLDRDHALIINGVTACTLGHNFKGAVVEHPYFGARVAGHRNILDDLAQCAGFESGRVDWTVTVHRNPTTGFIDSMTPVAAPKHASAINAPELNAAAF